MRFELVGSCTPVTMHFLTKPTFQITSNQVTSTKNKTWKEKCSWDETVNSKYVDFNPGIEEEKRKLKLNQL